MSRSKLHPWLFRVQPYADESFSHFLGRFRRANHLSHQTLAELLAELECDSPSERLCDRILPLEARCDSLLERLCDFPKERLRQRTLIQAWETPSRRCQPTASQLAVLAQLTQIEVSELSELLPPKAKFHTSTRLCSQCYQTEPIHRLSWQLADSPICGYHHRLLLSECPVCKTAFRLPSLWEVGRCERCWLPFEQMGDQAVPSNSEQVATE